jgi:hypothetical protein
MRLRHLSLPILLVLVAGCASTFARGAAKSDVITQEQMFQNDFHNAYEAVVALRSNWLQVRPNTFGAQEDVVVYYGAVRLGSPGAMSAIDVHTIAYIKHLDAPAATARYGVGHSQGAIVVSSTP